MSNALAPAGLLAVALVVASCGQPPAPPAPPDRLTLDSTDFSSLPGWADDDLSQALAPMRLSCARLAALPPERSLGPDGIAGTAKDWQAPCLALSREAPVGPEQARRYFETWFRPYAAGNRGNRKGLFTGYYEIELLGALTRDERARVPLYRRPPDLVTVDLGEFSDKLKGERVAGRVVRGQLRPYPDRAAIEAGALAGQGLELGWVDDPVAAFFLQIQGSGRVLLRDGTLLRVGYDGQNGHPYFAIGRELIARGALAREQVSLQSIRAWLEAHPADAASVMNRNPSFVFFRVLKEPGPLGGQGVVLTPGRSLAVDHRFVAYGTPVWLDAEDPVDPGRRLQRLLIAQDTGGAIRGPVRGDVFCGHGPEAERRAGVMKSSGGYALLLPRTVDPAAGEEKNNR